MNLQKHSSDVFPPNEIIQTSKTNIALMTQENTNLGGEDMLISQTHLPTIVGRRLVSLLSYLCTHNESILYEILKPRLTQSNEESKNDIGDHDDGISLNQSYLEVILNLLRLPNLTENSRDLLQVTQLIHQLCEPLDILTEKQDENSKSEEAKTSNDSDSDGDKVKWVKVPSVIISKVALRSLCDGLMNEHCTKEVFDHILSSITRLAYVKENCTVLIDVLVEVLIDLSSVSDSRMQTILTHIHNNNNNSSTLSQQIVLTIPLGEIGSQDHIRFLRSLQTLHKLSVKLNLKLNDIVPLEDFQNLWYSLDNVLKSLDNFVKSDVIEKNDQKKQQNSSLTSIISKLTPLIESFFLVHTTDLLMENSGNDAVTSNNATATIATTSTELQTNQKKEISEEKTETQQLESQIQLQVKLVQESYPGAKYRTTKGYKRVNISLFSPETELELQRGNSLTRLKSFQSTRSFRSTGSHQIDSISSPSSHLLNRSTRLLSFVHSHKNILNLIVRWYPSLLEGSLEALVRIIQLRSYLSFDNKRVYFYSQIKRRKQLNNSSYRSIHLQVHRESILDAINGFGKYYQNFLMKKRLYFYNLSQELRRLLLFIIFDDFISLKYFYFRFHWEVLLIYKE